METMPNWLKQRSYITPERIALEMGEECVTFVELDARVTKMAERLATLGISKGERVAVYMRNSVEMIVIIHALSYLGAIAVLLNIRLAKEELQWQIEDAEVQLVITDEEVQWKGVRIYHICDIEVLPRKVCSIQETFHLHEPMTIIYTSGTTGHPKGVILTYSNHWWSAVGSALHLGIHEDDCWLACLPFFHVGGLSILMKNIIYGMRVVIEKADAPLLNEAIATRGVTMISVVTKVLTDMVHEVEGYPRTLRCVLLGGGPAPMPLLEICVKKNIPVYQTYGMTETASQICTLTKDDMLRKVGSAGKPLYPCQLRIDAKEGPGEILVKGPNVTKGYFKREEATKESLRDGWFATGDIGYIDEDGFLYVLDRRSDLIISGGENIYPAQIEEVLLAHEAVLEAGVVGTAHDTWGEVPIAFVKTGVAVTEEELIAFCQNRLARYKVPHRIIFTGDLPRNASNKLLRRQLKERFVCE